MLLAKTLRGKQLPQDGQIAPAVPPAPQPTSDGGSSPGGIWTFIKDNKELFATATSLATALVGAITWAFAYFATQDRVNRLECTTSQNMLVQFLPAQIALDKLEIMQHSLELSQLRSLTSNGELANMAIKNLEVELKTFENERDTYQKQYDEVLDKMKHSDCFKPVIPTKEKPAA